MKRLIAGLLLAATALVPAATAAAAATPTTQTPVTVKVPVPKIPGLNLGGGCDGPPPAMPGRGTIGFFLHAPSPLPAAGDPFAPGATTSIYTQYQFAGYDWNTCDLNPAWEPDGANSNTVVNMVANWVMGVPEGILAFYSALTQVAFHPQMWLSYLRDPLNSAVDGIYRSFTLPAVSFALIAAGLMGATNLRKWETSRYLGILLTILLVGAGLGFVIQDPFRIVDTGSQIAPAAVTAATSGVDARNGGNWASNAAANADDAILYPRWLAGEFGDTTSPVAQTYGPTLFKDSALTWAEAAHARKDPRGYGAKIISEKQADFSTTMGLVKQADPDAYEYATGRRSKERVGQAFIALASTACALPFLLLALLMLVLIPMVLIVAILLFVVAGIMSIFGEEWHRFARGPIEMAAGAVINAVIFGVTATVQILAMNALLAPGSALPPWLAIVLLGALTVVLLRMTHPYRSMLRLLGAHTKKTHTRGMKYGQAALAFASSNGGAYLAGQAMRVIRRRNAALEAADTADEVDDAADDTDLTPDVSDAAPEIDPEPPLAPSDPEGYGWMHYPSDDDAVATSRLSRARVGILDRPMTTDVPARPVLEGAYQGHAFKPDVVDPTSDSEDSHGAAPTPPGVSRVVDDQAGVYRIFTPGQAPVDVPADTLMPGVDDGDPELPGGEAR